MPRIIVQANTGKTLDQKREIIRRITADVVEVFGNAPDTVSVLIQESETSNVGRGGVTDMDRQAQAKAAEKG